VLCLLLAVRPGFAAAQGSVFDETRFEWGCFDDRLLLFLTQTAPLVQQFTGMTAAALVPCMGVEWGVVRLDWTAALELGLSFDSTGLARWFVRAIEQDNINRRTGRTDPPPALSADLLFGSPLYLPLRLRTEAELRVLPFLRLQAGVEAAGVLLLFPPDVSSFRFDMGVTFGLLFTLGRAFGMGLRARIVNFGDLEDRWPGFGLTLYCSWSPFARDDRSD
jgi:hypothetical protein